MNPRVTASTIAALDEARYAELVLDNLGHEAPPGLWDLLTGPDLNLRTSRVLTGQVKELEDQSADRRTELDVLRSECFAEGPSGKDRFFAAKADVDEWRARMRRYRRLIDRRLAQARAGRKQAHVVHQARNGSEARILAAKLTCAISEHQGVSLAAGITPERHDQALWGLLDELTATFAGEPLTLREALDTGLWSNESIPAEPCDRDGDDDPGRVA